MALSSRLRRRCPPPPRINGSETGRTRILQVWRFTQLCHYY